MGSGVEFHIRQKGGERGGGWGAEAKPHVLFMNKYQAQDLSLIKGLNKEESEHGTSEAEERGALEKIYYGKEQKTFRKHLT